MRSATIVGSILAMIAATACSSVSPAPHAQPKPAAKRAPSTAASLGIPPGHLPPPGQCRVWNPGQPPGHQAKARSCDRIERAAPAGSWIVYRPGDDKKVVHVRVIDTEQPGIVVSLRVYDAKDGRLLRES